MSDAGLRDALLTVERFLSEPTNESLFRRSARVLAQALDEQERFVAPKPSMWRKLRQVVDDDLDSGRMSAWGEGKRYPPDPAAMMTKLAEVMRKSGVVTHANQARPRAPQGEAAPVEQAASSGGGAPAPAPPDPPSLAERLRALPLEQLLERMAQWRQMLGEPGGFASFCTGMRAFVPEDGLAACLAPLGGGAADLERWSQGAPPPDPTIQRRTLQQIAALLLQAVLREPTLDVATMLMRLRWAGALVQDPGMAEAVARLNHATGNRWSSVTSVLLHTWAHAPALPAVPPDLVAPLQGALTEVLAERFRTADWSVA